MFLAIAYAYVALGATAGAFILLYHLAAELLPVWYHERFVPPARWPPRIIILRSSPERSKHWVVWAMAAAAATPILNLWLLRLLLRGRRRR